jgi:hypothetical protein
MLRRRLERHLVSSFILHLSAVPYLHGGVSKNGRLGGGGARALRAVAESDKLAL